jgi:hypothetical protein
MEVENEKREKEEEERLGVLVFFAAGHSAWHSTGAAWATSRHFAFGSFGRYDIVDS